MPGMKHWIVQQSTRIFNSLYIILRQEEETMDFIYDLRSSFKM